MDGQVGISDIDALHTFRASLLRSRDDIDGALTAFDRELDRCLQYIGERELHWRQTYDIWRREAERLEYELDRCLRSGTEDYPPNCDHIVQALRTAQWKAQEALANAQLAKAAFDAAKQASDDYRARASKARSSLGEATTRAGVRLSDVAARARRVHTSGAPGGVIFDAAPGGLATSSAVASGVHAPGSLDGAEREGAPNPDGVEGRIRGELEGGPSRERGR